MFDVFVQRSFTQAKFIAPKDTLNLVLRAMTVQNYGDEAKIVYRGSVAPYIDYLEFGTKRFDGHKGFIENTTVNALRDLADSMYNNRFEEAQFRTVRQNVDNLKPSLRTDFRYLQSIGGAQNVSR